MAIELAGAKMIAPFYGTSLYVWASVLGVTLGGLATGYFTGGRLSHRYPGKQLLFIVLVVGAVLIALMPISSPRLMAMTADLGVRMGSLVAAVFFIMPPLVCMGMVSPILIQLATEELESTGRIAGSVYALSTVGGIVMTFLVGFFLIPEWGVKNSIFLTAFLIAIIPMIWFLFRKKQVVGVVLFAGLLSFMAYKSLAADSIATDKFEILHRSEGLLGQLTVVERPFPLGGILRELWVNGIPQTVVKKGFEPTSGWPYVHRIATLASIKPTGSRALLLGLGGGSVAMELLQLGFRVDGVDIDPRMVEVGKEFFGLEETDAFSFTVDDARHFIRHVDAEYDLVVIDLASGEVQPSHVFTLEGLSDLRRIVKEDVLLIVKFQGYLVGEKGLAARSIYRTLMDSGFRVRHFHEPASTVSDIIFIASLAPRDFSKIPTRDLNVCCRALNYTHEDLLSDGEIGVRDSLILTDDKPVLELINSQVIMEWRRARMPNAETFVEEGIPLFH